MARGGHCKAIYSPFRPLCHLGDRRVMGLVFRSFQNPTKASSQGLPHPRLGAWLSPTRGQGSLFPVKLGVASLGAI